MKSRIYALGETILDIIFKKDQPETAKPGGSSFNASITLGRLGAPVDLISETGKDRVGNLVEKFMLENGVSIDFMSRFQFGSTAIALAFLNEQNDADYQFFKNYPAQRLEQDMPDFTENDYLLFGSIYAMNSEIRPRVKEILDRARAARTTIIYDPNFRENHADELEQMLPMIKENMEYATIVRASNEDLLTIFGASGIDVAWEAVRPLCSNLVYTANAGGVYLRTPERAMHMESRRIDPVSTIGAGDTFNAGLIYGLWHKGLNGEELASMEEGEWTEILDRAVEFSAAVCMSYDNYLPLEFVKTFKN